MTCTPGFVLSTLSNLACVSDLLSEVCRLINLIELRTFSPDLLIYILAQTTPVNRSIKTHVNVQDTPASTKLKMEFVHRSLVKAFILSIIFFTHYTHNSVSCFHIMQNATYDYIYPTIQTMQKITKFQR